MELYLQFGYGMMEHCRTLLTSWGGGSVILSPRDLTHDQLVRFASSLTSSSNCDLLLDPQFYLPHANHDRLCSHDYWPAQYDTGAFWQGPGLNTLLRRLAELNNTLATRVFVLPGLLASRIDDDWLAIQQSVLDEAVAMRLRKPLMMTIALSAEATRNQDQIATLLERAESWEPASYYLVFEHPNGQYLVNDPNWLANVVDVTAGLRLLGRSVVVGYCNHQMLVVSLAKSTAIASGTWMNVRSFPPEKFMSDYDEEMRQRATWYYCPQALSEYKIPFLDIAARLGILNHVAPPAELDGGFVSTLFSGVQPSSVGFTEQSAFRHYLHALHLQSRAAERASFDETVDGQRRLLDEAGANLRILGAAGIRGHNRDFTEILDVNRAALELIVSLRGPILRRRWESL